MKHRRTRYFLGLSTIAVSTILVGCGGGGGGSSSPRPTSTPRPTATPVGGACTSTTYTPNYISEIGTGLQQWPGFPLRVYLPPTDSRTRALTIRGFNQWVTATNGGIRYEVVDSADNADITVTFGIFTGGNQLGLTTTYYRSGGTQIERAEIEFSYYAFDSRNDAEDLNQSIAAHEFGHALGISGHSPSRNDLMYPVITHSLEDITPSDLNTLRTIYCDSYPTRNNAVRKQQSGVLLKRVIKN